MNQPTITRGIFGLNESDLPPGGIEHTAVWPIVASAPGRPAAALITAIRRAISWRAMRQHATTIVELELVDPPRRIEHQIRRLRKQAGLADPTTR